MATDNMQLSLKITADLNDAKNSINALNTAIKETASTAQSSNTKSAQSWQNVYAAQNEAMTRGQRAIEQERQQALAQEKAAKAAEAHQKHVEKLRRELDSLLGSIDPAIKALGRLDEQEQKLRQSYKAGLIDTESYQDFLGKITDQRDAVSNVDKLTQGTQKLAFNTKTSRRELTTLIRQLAQGNFAYAGNSILNLGHSTGMLPRLFSVATVSVGVFAGAAYGLYSTISRILADQERFNNALIITGNYAGTTASGLEAMAQKVGSINRNYSETRGVIAELAQDGTLSAQSIEHIATAAAHMSALTGQSAKDAVTSFDKIKSSVTDWALETNKQYHWLDIATYQRIATLEAQGKTEEAIALATEQYADVIKARVEEMHEQLNWLESGWESFKNGISRISETLKNELKLNLGLATLDDEIKKLESAKKMGGYSGFGYVMAWDESFEKELQAKIAERDQLEREAQQQRRQLQIQESAITAQKSLQDYWQQNISAEEKQAKAIENVRQQYETLWQTVDGRKSLQEKHVFSEDGKTFAGGQYDADIKAITDKSLVQYNEQLAQTIALQEDSTQLARVMYETTQGAYKNASEAEKQRAIESAKAIDAYKAQQKALQKSKRLAKSAASENERFVKSLESLAAKQTTQNFATRQAQINARGLAGDLLARANAANETIQLEENKKAQQALNDEFDRLFNDGLNKKTAEIMRWYEDLKAKFQASGDTDSLIKLEQILDYKKAEAELNAISVAIEKIKQQQSQKEQSIQAGVNTGAMTEIDAQRQLLELHQLTAAELQKYIPTLQQIALLEGAIGDNARQMLSTLQLEVSALQRSSDLLTQTFQNSLQSGIATALGNLATGTEGLSDSIKGLARTVVNAMAQIAAQQLAQYAMQGIGSLFGAASVAAATGGYITGPGTGTSDSIPARLSNGEFVINAKAVKNIGVDYLHAINRQQIKPFFEGGLASNVQSPAAPSTTKDNQQQGAMYSPVIQQELHIDAGDVMSKGVSSVVGQRALKTFIRANKQTLRQDLGIKD